jgi:hypothetical protein
MENERKNEIFSALMLENPVIPRLSKVRFFSSISDTFSKKTILLSKIQVGLNLGLKIKYFGFTWNISDLDRLKVQKCQLD